MTHREVEVRRPTAEEAEADIVFVGKIQTPCGSEIRLEKTEADGWRIVFSAGGQFTPRDTSTPAPPPPPAVEVALVKAADELIFGDDDHAFAEIPAEPERDAPPV